MLDLRGISGDPDPVRAALARRKDGSDERLMQALALRSQVNALKPELEAAQAEEAVKAAQRQVTQMETTWEAAKKEATADGTNSGTRHTFARQGLELRRVEADQALVEAQRRVNAVLAAQRLVDAVTTLTTEHQNREVEAKVGRTALDAATAEEQSASEQIGRLDLLERAVEARAAEETGCCSGIGR